MSSQRLQSIATAKIQHMRIVYAGIMSHRLAAFTNPAVTAVVLTQRRALSQFQGDSWAWACPARTANSAESTAPKPRWRRLQTSVATGVETTVKDQVSEPNTSKSQAKSGKREKKGSSSPALLKALDKYEPVIGIEVHVQLSTRTKAYCKCSTKAVRTPNVNICPVCMGHPGALPVVNAKVVELAAKTGIALGCTVSQHSRYDRKNYYYPDTAKNYQITQDRFPIATGGQLQLGTSGKVVGITRLHMEEDAAKMSHEGAGAAGRLTDSTHSLIDFNRSGIPLVEIVSEPDIRSGAEAAEYGQELQRILRYVGTSDCNMQDGSLRCDVNISIRQKGKSEFGTKVELKNLNSFSAAQKCVDFEIERQAELLESGQRVVLETRTWDEKTNETRTMRVKEGAADYRYFPEPDIPPLNLSEAQLELWSKTLPELPAAKRQRYQEVFGLSSYDAFMLSDDVSTARYFEAAVADGADAKQAANWIMGDITKVLKVEKLDIPMCKLSAVGLAEMIRLIDGGIISGKVAKDLVPELVTKGGSPAEIVEERGLKMISDVDAIRQMASTVIDENPKELKAFKEGKDRLFGFFVGKTLGASGGRADPVLINEVLKDLLKAAEAPQS